MDWRILAFTAFLSILSVAVFALVPAWMASRHHVNPLLKRDTLGTHIAAKTFIVAEVALSLVLLAGAGLLMQSLVRLTSTPLGFQPAHLLAGNIELTPKTYSVAAQRLAFYDELKNRMAASPECRELPSGARGGRKRYLGHRGQAHTRSSRGAKCRQCC